MTTSMASRAILSLTVAACLLWGPHSSAKDVTCVASEAAAIAVKLTVIAVPDFQGDPAMYKSDGDPSTLEIVIIMKRKGVSSYVSPDGEVIFLVGKVSDKKQQQLLQDAFCLKAAAAHQ